MADKTLVPDGGKIIVKPLESVMHDSMMPYAEYVIMERALPRVEDGMKPVQRRIMYAMHELGMTPDKPYRKSAAVVGEVLAKYHPHGDTAVYDAMVRMAQNFNMSETLVDGHGNMGSVDGDSAAAMRYTEARLAPLALEMLRDIEKETVPMTLNYDDSRKEPVVLPSRFPNLLVNGAAGIAVGLATNIPTHNLGEVLEGAIAYYKNPNITLGQMMQYVPGPDFPTGGFCSTGEELKKAYETGRGKLLLRAKTSIEKDKNGRQRIVIEELPYQTNKTSLLERILKLCEDRKADFAGITDIRDESDRTGMRAVVELRKDADAQRILQLLYKYSDLQVTFGVNIVAIADGRPRQLGLLDIYRYYTEYQKNVVSARTRYDLEQAERREHILLGLIIAVQNIDEVIRIIRSSASPKDARLNLMKRFDLTGEQAQAVLDMRLRRLTALELNELKAEYDEVVALIKELKGILDDERKLVSVIIKEIKAISKQFSRPRRTKLDVIESVSIEEIQTKKESEPCTIVFTAAQTLKRISNKSIAKTGMDVRGDVKISLNCMTNDRICLFTDRGNLFNLTAEDVPECRLRDRGAYVAALLPGLEKGETVISVIQLQQDSADLLFLTKNGMIKRTAAAEYQARRNKLVACSLKDGDSVLDVVITTDTDEILLISQNGFAVRFSASQTPAQGRAAAGVKGIALQENDKLVFAGKKLEDELVLITERGYAKRMPAEEIPLTNRNIRGSKAFPAGKTANADPIVSALFCKKTDELMVEQHRGMVTPIPVLTIAPETLRGRGKPVVMALFDDVVVSVKQSFSTN